MDSMEMSITVFLFIHSRVIDSEVTTFLLLIVWYSFQATTKNIKYYNQSTTTWKTETYYLIMELFV
jgi:hypothetical protein